MHSPRQVRQTFGDLDVTEAGFFRLQHDRGGQRQQRIGTKDLINFVNPFQFVQKPGIDGRQAIDFFHVHALVQGAGQHVDASVT